MRRSSRRRTGSPPGTHAQIKNKRRWTGRAEQRRGRRQTTRGFFPARARERKRVKKKATRRLAFAGPGPGTRKRHGPGREPSDRTTERREVGSAGDRSVDAGDRATTRTRERSARRRRVSARRASGDARDPGHAARRSPRVLFGNETHVMDVVAHARAEAWQAAHDRGYAANATRARSLASISRAHGVGKGVEGGTRDRPEVRSRAYKCGTISRPVVSGDWL